MKNLAEKIYNEILKEKKLVLSESQKEKFLVACQKSIDLNLNLSYEVQKSAARSYLDFVLNVPGLSLESDLEV